MCTHRLLINRQIRLVTTSNSSPEFIRLWLERSGTKIPLDIEIYLHVHSSSIKQRKADPWTLPPGIPTPHTAIVAAMAQAPAPVQHQHQPPEPAPVLGAQATIPLLPQNAYPQIPAHMDPLLNDWRNGRKKTDSLSSTSWGHVALFYLSDQMHRWKRFIFRFDRQFESASALRNISSSSLLECKFCCMLIF